MKLFKSLAVTMLIAFFFYFFVCVCIYNEGNTYNFIFTMFSFFVLWLMLSCDELDS